MTPQERLTAEIIRAVRKVRSGRSPEGEYAFVLRYLPAEQRIVADSNSEAGWAQACSSLRPKPKAAERHRLRWREHTWARAGEGAAAFEPARKPLAALPSPRRTALALEAMEAALATLSREGLFGEGLERRDFFLNALVDSPEDDRARLERAWRLNDRGLVKQVAAALGVAVPQSQGKALGSQRAYQICGLARSADGTTLAACGSGTELFAWKLGRAPRELKLQRRRDSQGKPGVGGPLSTEHWSCALSADGSLLAVSDREVILRQYLNGRPPLPVLRGPRENVASLALAPDASWVAATSWDGWLRCWDGASGAVRWKQRASHLELAMSLDGALLAIPTTRGIALLEASTGRVRGTLGREHAGALAFAPDGALLASDDAASSGTVRLWDVRRRKVVRELGGVTPVTALAFSDDGAWLAVAFEDGPLGVWDLATGARLLWAAGRHESCLAVAFLRDGRVASAGRDLRSGPPVTLWSLQA